jgi:uncharacterized membrane protein YccC
MSQSAATQPAVFPGGAGGAPGQAARLWWRVSWSRDAALRAVRATIVIPGLFALSLKVIGGTQLALFAAFGSFAQLVTVTFSGTRRDKATAHLGLTVVGVLGVAIGTLASGSAWTAALVTIPVAFVIYLGGSAGQNAAAAVTACLFAFVLPVTSKAPVAVLPARLEGWLLAAAVSTLAVLALSPRQSGDQLRARAADLAAALASVLAAVIVGDRTEALTDAALRVRRELMSAWFATPYRPVGLAPADQGLAKVIHLLEWCTSMTRDMSASLALSATADTDRQLLGACVEALRQICAVLSGAPARTELAEAYLKRLGRARDRRELAGEAAAAMRDSNQGFRPQVIALAVATAIGEAMIAARRATPAEVARSRATSHSGLPAAPSPDAPRPFPGGALLASDASLRSVWVRNSARGAIALAVAVGVGRGADVQHAFWVVLGTLSVLRNSAAATGTTALRALAGTAVGFAVGAALLVGIGTSPPALWVAFPIAVLITAYAPGAAPFVLGQAAFTVMAVVEFNLLAPAGWRVGLLRVEDVAIGCAVSLVVGFLFWPRGASGVVGDKLADALRAGAGYLTETVSWVLGDRRQQPEHVAAVAAADIRLDDAVRGYLTEQGSKRVSQADLWVLVMAATRLRLLAHSMLSSPSAAATHDDRRLRATLTREAGDMAGFYRNVAVDVASPARTALLPLPGQRLRRTRTTAAGRWHHRDDTAAWVRQHLAELAAHLADIVGPAERLAGDLRRPWWR